jgi:hypothetical protein
VEETTGCTAGCCRCIVLASVEAGTGISAGSGGAAQGRWAAQEGGNRSHNCCVLMPDR